jgi:hypothetical protein
MLNSNRKGYAVMTEDLQAYSLEDESLGVCKKYCYEGYVVCERIPVKVGFSIRIYWCKFWKPIYFKYAPHNLLWLHFQIEPIYLHKTGKIIFKPKEGI